MDKKIKQEKGVKPVSKDETLKKETKKEEKIVEMDSQTTEVEVESMEEAVDDIDAEVLKKRLKEQEEKNQEYFDRLQRTMAEFDNFRKRTVKEKSNMYDMGVKDTVEKILPIIDNFERALLNTKEGEEINDGFVQGVEMIYKQFKNILDEMGVKEIEAIGKPFDPNFHNAVTHVQDEKYKENEVIEEFQKGYLYQDQVIRYSMVTVAN
ncbi:MAG: nucleotide exchange factor GrpE [Epulopiscium sp.]|nr:nucleotide exchange factor GrpE [Candidatus Epulonipiscium sp.]